MGPKRALVASFPFLLCAATACSSGERPRTPEPPANASTTVVAVAPATTAPTVRPTRTPEDTIPTRPAAGPVVVYAARVAPVSPGGPWKCELVGFDTGAGAVWSAHEA